MDFTQFLKGQLDIFAHQIVKLADQFGSGDLTPEGFREGFEGLKGAVNRLGAVSFVALVEEADTSASEIERDGKVYRRKKDPSSKKWCTPWGRVSVDRGLYQQDRGGEAYIPLDERCGMVDRFMTPDLEEVSVLLGTRIVPSEVHQALSRVYPHAPSRKAIQNVLTKAGAYIETHLQELEETLSKDAPLDTRGDILVASLDGTTVPLREPAPQRGRPAERPGVKDSDESPTAWKEAGVGLVSVYDSPLDPSAEEEEAERRDVRYFGHMPEPKMAHVVSQITDEAKAALQKGSFEYKVFIADGKKEIWRTVEENPVFSEFTPVLDFWHAIQHLSSAAEAVYGKKSDFAKAYFGRWRHNLKHDPGAVEGLIRSLARYQKKFGKRSESYKVLKREIGYFRANRARMDYAGYRAKGLPIGSGPIEAACKTLVGHRLKRSGMRWERPSGQEILNLRAPLLSKRWDVTWNWYLTHPTKMANAA